MSAPHLTCDWNVPPEQLSALRDGTLASDAARRLSSHIATCPACQQRLQDYERIAAALALQRQVVPEPEDLLHRIHEGMRSPTPVKKGIASRRQSWASRRMWSSAGAIAALLLVSIGIVALLHTRSFAGSGPVAPASPTVSAGSFQTGPYQVLSLAVSPARPDQIAGCAIPRDPQSITLDAGIPVLMLSDDGGRTWQTYTIPAAPMMKSCTILADTVLPGTFVVLDFEATLLLTRDSGQTWHQLRVPNYMTLSGGIYTNPALVDGHLIGIFTGTFITQGRYALGDLGLDGSFRMLDAHLPYPGNEQTTQSPEAFVVDPSNAAHIYVATWAAKDPVSQTTRALDLFVTGNAGQTWTHVYTWQPAEHLGLWMPVSGTLYARMEYPIMPGRNLLSLSQNGGKTWKDIATGSTPIADIWMGPTGRVVLLVGNTLYELDSTDGRLAIIGANSFHSPVTGVIVEGQSPALLVTGPNSVQTYPLP